MEAIKKKTRNMIKNALYFCFVHFFLLFLQIEERYRLHERALKSEKEEEEDFPVWGDTVKEAAAEEEGEEKE